MICIVELYRDMERISNLIDELYRESDRSVIKSLDRSVIKSLDRSVIHIDELYRVDAKVSEPCFLDGSMFDTDERFRDFINQ